jgi:hypothetical protein
MDSVSNEKINLSIVIPGRKNGKHIPNFTFSLLWANLEKFYLQHSAAKETINDPSL